MKVFILTALTSALVFSCSKSSSENPQLITGRWELRGSVGGIAGTITYPSGNGIVLFFKANGQYIFSSPGPLIQTGTYTLKESSHKGDWILHAYYTANGQPGVDTDSIRFSDNKMYFLPSLSCCDIAANFYERLP